MRIVGGQWKGRRLEAPPDNDITRPTTDRVREALASMVLSALSFELEEISVLDCFAGSGALGIELLSRGAATATFIEKDRRAADRVRRNLASLVEDINRYQLVCADAFKLAKSQRIAGAPFDIVLLDPPYRISSSDVSQLIVDVDDAGLLNTAALLVYERDGGTPELEVVGFSKVRSKRYGRTYIDLLRRDR
ncbi:MAG: 16S rRNA (guanine(966)-N(2))-methyltransferase RsmD [Atopobiaceae bacterium]|nr:16S rRNA (guanine(966)-N(2))-methyltransferase RsmD [Atopobiaceae bacterium]